MNLCGKSIVMPLELGSMGSDDADVAERDPSGRYIRFEEILGRGACKTVYKAFDEIEGIEVAWNRVRIKEVLQSPEHLERLYSEVHLLKSLKHDNIIKCYHSWVDDANQTVNMITELFTSGSLRQYRKKHRNVDFKAIKNWARQVLKGLQYLHGHNPPIIHRDLKCDNIFINGNAGKVKIGDLGLAVVMHQPTAHSVIGTPEFMAPELYEEEYNELVDIYSFGLCMLEMVTCEYPYSECKNPAQIYKKVCSGVKPASLGKVGDQQVKEFIERCLLPASLRTSASELLEDPFLAFDSLGKLSCTSLPSSSKAPELQSHWMDIDSDYRRSSCIAFSESSYRLPPATIELSKSNNANSFSLLGKEDDESSISMTLRIANSSGHGKNIHFVYYLQKDTTISIAGEMVDELGLPNEDATVIADLMDDLIRTITSKSSCRSSIEEVGTRVLSRSTEDHNAQESLLHENSYISACSDGAELRKGSNSGVYDIASTSSISSLTLVEEGNKCDELKTELAAIDAHYEQLVAELMNQRADAIENAKRRWISRRIPVA